MLKISETAEKILLYSAVVACATSLSQVELGNSEFNAVE